jgi:glucan phosphoethanolaminetransferase (alkaline phosphatase superfamily)
MSKARRSLGNPGLKKSIWHKIEDILDSLGALLGGLATLAVALFAIFIVIVMVNSVMKPLLYDRVWSGKFIYMYAVFLAVLCIFLFFYLIMEVKAGHKEIFVCLFISLALGILVYTGFHFVVKSRVKNAKAVAEEETETNRNFKPAIEEIKNMKFPDASTSSLALKSPIKPPFLILLLKQASDSKKRSYKILTDQAELSSLKVSDVPDAIKTVIVIRKRAETIRRYNYGEDDQWNFDCWLIDWESRSIVAYKTFKGSEPGSSAGTPTSGGYDVEYGSEPWDQLLLWLNNPMH